MYVIINGNETDVADICFEILASIQVQIKTLSKNHRILVSMTVSMVTGVPKKGVLKLFRKKVKLMFIKVYIL